MLESICPSGQPIEHGSVPRTIPKTTEGREMVGVVGDTESTVGELNTCGISTPTENVEAEPVEDAIEEAHSSLPSKK